MSTHRRSVAKRGGCFQRRLFVCQVVCQFVCSITSERLNVGRSNLAVRYIVQKSRPTSNVKDQGHKGQKTTKNSESSPLTMHSRVCAVARPYAATDDTIACRPGVTGYADGKFEISACCLVARESESACGSGFNCLVEAEDFSTSKACSVGLGFNCFGLFYLLISFLAPAECGRLQ